MAVAGLLGGLAAEAAGAAAPAELAADAQLAGAALALATTRGRIQPPLDGGQLLGELPHPALVLAPHNLHLVVGIDHLLVGGVQTLDLLRQFPGQQLSLLPPLLGLGLQPLLRLGQAGLRGGQVPRHPRVLLLQHRGAGLRRGELGLEAHVLISQLLGEGEELALLLPAGRHVRHQVGRLRAQPRDLRVLDGHLLRLAPELHLDGLQLGTLRVQINYLRLLLGKSLLQLGQTRLV